MVLFTKNMNGSFILNDFIDSLMKLVHLNVAADKYYFLSYAHRVVELGIPLHNLLVGLQEGI